MKLKGLFWILSFLLIAIPAAVTWIVFYTSAPLYILVAVEIIALLTVIYLVFFYRRIIKPLQIIGDGMELLKEQDFGSRLRLTNQPDADRIVELFNRMMEQLKNERLRVREQHHFLDLLIDASPLGIIILDLNGNIRSTNPAVFKLLDLPADTDIAGKKLIDISHPLFAELLNVKKDSAETIRLGDANVYKCTHSSFMDKGFTNSFYLIELLTEEVFEAEMKAYENVIRMIAHEVNNATAGIVSTLDTLETTLQEMEQPDAGEALRITIERCYSMNRFITNFADVVRIPEPQLREYELNAVVLSCKRFMETICLNRNIKLVLELCDTSPIVHIDSVLIEQALVNIIKNSAEAIEQDGTIRIITGHSPACLEIADNGKGISKDAESKLFTPFYSTKPQGQGIGLMLIREILLKHGCTFSLRTGPDGLTRFKILF
ncbi:MAG: PAS domain-containing protein [Tannerella sp.]|jgi:nitrogen fixation/metabolism regulation signal transduction histidine kinase|nr:PAS domain-containing protein [Tannerella sp.]